MTRQSTNQGLLRLHQLFSVKPCQSVCSKRSLCVNPSVQHEQKETASCESEAKDGYWIKTYEADAAQDYVAPPLLCISQSQYENVRCACNQPHLIASPAGFFALSFTNNAPKATGITTDSVRQGTPVPIMNKSRRYIGKLS